jgi:site-specific DNA-cytosine methylase
MLGNSNKAKEISNCIPASIYHHGTVVNQDADAGHVIVDMIQYQIAVRKLTPVECERLQSFPEGWTDGQVDTGRYKQMGNAVTVAVVAWIGARL